MDDRTAYALCGLSNRIADVTAALRGTAGSLLPPPSAPLLTPVVPFSPGADPGRVLGVFVVDFCREIFDWKSDVSAGTPLQPLAALREAEPCLRAFAALRALAAARAEFILVVVWARAMSAS